MNRLAKKCVIASGVLHGTLALTLLLASGFADSPSQLPGPAELTILQLPVDEPASKPVTDGGRPVAQVRPNIVAARPVSETRTPFTLGPMVPNPHVSKEPDNHDGAADAHKAFETALNNIQNHTSGRVDIKSLGDKGGASASQESLEAVLQRVYFNSWRQPADATSEDAVVKVAVTVARDGAVVSAVITKSSGDPAVDRSVERLLKEVTYIAPFPSGSKEAQRVFPLSFSLKAKRSLG